MAATERARRERRVRAPTPTPSPVPRSRGAIRCRLQRTARGRPRNLAEPGGGCRAWPTSTLARFTACDKRPRSHVAVWSTSLVAAAIPTAEERRARILLSEAAIPGGGCVMFYRSGAVCAALMLLVSGVRAQADDSGWVATWSTAMQAPLVETPADVSNQTVRQIVRVSRGGRGVRVRFSNALGSTP